MKKSTKQTHANYFFLPPIITMQIATRKTGDKTGAKLTVVSC